MSIWDLIIDKPSLATLAQRFPFLRRYAAQGFETNINLHATDVVGMENPITGQRLRVHLLSGDLIPA